MQIKLESELTNMAFEKNEIAEADKLMKRYNSHDPFEIAKNANIPVLEAPLGEITYADRAYYKRINVITLNSNINDAWKNFVLAHELGHCYLHHGFSTTFYRNTPSSGMINWAEKEASTFAMEILDYQLREEDAYYQLTPFEKLDHLGLPYSLEDYLV